MTNEIASHEFKDDIMDQQALIASKNTVHFSIVPAINTNIPNQDNAKDLAEILFITSYPPRECGIATYSQDLIKALNNKFSNSLSIKI